MLNKITIHGYLGNDPILSEHTNSSGTFYLAKFRVGVPRDYGDESDWFFVTSYNRQAQLVDKYLKKGSEVLIEGRLESYRPMNDPDKLYWNLKARKLDFCGKKTDKPVEEAPDGFTEVGEDFDLF